MLPGFPLDDKDPEQFVMPIKEKDGQKDFRDTQGWHVCPEREFQNQPLHLTVTPRSLLSPS